MDEPSLVAAALVVRVPASCWGAEGRLSSLRSEGLQVGLCLPGLGLDVLQGGGSYGVSLLVPLLVLSCFLVALGWAERGLCLLGGSLVLREGMRAAGQLCEVRGEGCAFGIFPVLSLSCGAAVMLGAAVHPTALFRYRLAGLRSGAVGQSAGAAPRLVPALPGCELLFPTGLQC